MPVCRLPLNEAGQRGFRSFPGERFASNLPEGKIRVVRGELGPNDFERRAIELEAQVEEGEPRPVMQNRMLAIPASKDRPPIAGQALGGMNRGDCKVVECFVEIGIEMEAGILLIDEDSRITERGPLFCGDVSDLLQSIQPKSHVLPSGRWISPY